MLWCLSIGHCISYFTCCDQICDQRKLKGGRLCFVLQSEVMQFITRGWASDGSVCLAYITSYLLEVEERRQEEGQGYKASRPSPSGPFLPIMRPHLLKVPQLPKQHPQRGTSVQTHEPVGLHSYSNHTRCIYYILFCFEFWCCTDPQLLPSPGLACSLICM